LLPSISLWLRVHASLWADLATRGVAVGEGDLMIGASAIAKDYAFATRDERSFQKKAGLKERQTDPSRKRTSIAHIIIGERCFNSDRQ